MSTTQQAYEEVIKQLTEIAQKSGDTFHAKVLRRNTDNDPMPTQFAAFNNVTLDQIINREEWLPELVGPEGASAVLDMQIYDGETRTKPLVMANGVIRTRVTGSGTSTIPNIQAMMDKGWRGPRQLTYPDPRTLKTQQPAAVASVSTPAAAQPQVTMQDARNALAAPTGTAAASDAAATRLLDAAAQLAKQREELAEARHQMELQKLRNEQDLKFAQLQAQVSQKPQQSGGDWLEKLPALLTGLAAVVTPIVASLSETAKERNRQLVESQKEAAAAARESTKAMIDAQEKQFAALQQTVEKIVEKKDDGSSEVYKKMSEATVTMAGTMMQMVHQMAELPQGEPPEPGWVKAVGMISEAAQNIATKIVDVNANRPAVALPPRAALPAPQAVQATQPQPQPVQQPQAAAPAPQTAPQPPANEVDVIEGMIREQYPVEQVRDYFFEIVQRRDMMNALATHDGDFEKLITTRLGVWLLNKSNQDYVKALGESINEMGIKLGLIDPSKDDAEEADASDDSEAEEASEEASEEEETAEAEPAQKNGTVTPITQAATSPEAKA